MVHEGGGIDQSIPRLFSNRWHARVPPAQQGGTMVISTTTSSVATIAASLDTQNLHIERVIVHRIHARKPDKTIDPPIHGTALVKLPAGGKDALQTRIVNALGSRSHGIQVSIERTDVSDFFQIAAHAIHGTDPAFIKASQRMADALTLAQGAVSAPAGALAIIAGRTGALPRRYIAAIKAETQDGFGAGGATGSVDFQYLQNLLLTPTQRFYKIGLLLELEAAPAQSEGAYDASDYRAYLFDHLITALETRQAAAYFYQTFLGMDIQKSAKRLTRDFFEHTRNFAQSSSLTDEAKADIKEALRVELRSDNSLIDPNEFAKQHIPPALRRQFRAYLDEKNFPKTSVPKDTEYVKAKLRRPRQLTWPQGIKLFIPQDASQNTYSIEKKSGSTIVHIQGDFKEVD